MNSWRSYLVLSAMTVVVLFSFRQPSTSEESLSYPSHWPEPHYDFARNPLTKHKIDLGRKLFYDPILSKDGSVTCANCHLSFTAFTHVDHSLSHGINDSIGNRNSMALMNLAWSSSFMWDGAIERLDAQALAPITHPAEMGETLENVLQKLKASAVYPELFAEAYGNAAFGTRELLDALAQFQLTLVSDNSNYDKAQRGEYDFTEQEAKGYRLFKIHCNSCHQEPLFTTGKFENNGLPLDSTLQDLGRYAITDRPADSLKFKTPTLRNVEFSKPYMHDGRFATLREVLDHYHSGIDRNATVSEKLKNGIALTGDQKTELIAFMLTLSDRSFLFNPDFGYPRN